LRSVDGRLREILAKPECRGACLPDARWLDLTNTRYLLTDKVYDLWHEDVAYDTQFTLSLPAFEAYTLDNLPAFEANALDVLYQVNNHLLPAVEVIATDDGSQPMTMTEARDARAQVESFTRARYTLAEAAALTH